MQAVATYAFVRINYNELVMMLSACCSQVAYKQASIGDVADLATFRTWL